MGRVREDRRWRCKSCHAVTLEPALLTAPSPFCDTYELTGCPECKDCSEGFTLLCDEPQCIAEATGGFPTGNDADAWGGYRQTCWRHRQETPNVHAHRRARHGG